MLVDQTLAIPDYENVWALGDCVSVPDTKTFAWLLWRGVYLSKLPGLERKVRVLTDWTLELFFPRDIVQTIEFNDSGMRQKDPKVAVT